MKSIILTIFLFIIFFESSYSQNGWVLSNGPTRRILNSVCIANENYIYISGDSIINNVSDPNVSFFLVSSNGGINWQKSYNFAGGTLVIFKDHSPTRIYSATWQRTGKNSANSYINYMDIGGTSFTISYTAFGSYEYIRNFNYIAPDILYASSAARILKRIGNGGYITIPSNITQTTALYFINSSTGFASRYDQYFPMNNKLLKTTNSGTSWDSLNNSGYIKLYFYNEYLGFSLSGSGNRIYKTTDGGYTWNISSPSTVNDFYFFNSDTGYSCGSSGRIQKTVNGGENWVMQTTPITSKLNSICFYSSDFGVAVGDSGKILITNSTGIGINPIGNTIPKKISLSQNYPNPFNPNTKIKFALPMSSFVKIIVCNMLGEEIQTLVNEELNPGLYETSFNSSKFASGVYYYMLSAGDYIETKKMILIK